MSRDFRWVLLVPLLLAVSCSDDDPGEGSATGSASASTAGGSGPADGEAIRIGFANMDSVVPDIRHGAEAAQAFVNDELGGVDGRPLEYVFCEVDGSPEASIDCANQFVEEGVVLVHQGADAGSDAMLPILADAGIPMVGLLPLGVQQASAPDVYFFGMSTDASYVSILSFAAEEDIDSVTFLSPDGPAARASVDDVLTPAAESLDIDMDAVYYQPGADWNVLASTARDGDPGMIGFLGSPEPDCISGIGALRAAGYDGRIFAAGCSTFVEALGDQATGVVTFSFLWRADDLETPPDAKREEVEAYIDAMTEAGYEDEVAGFGQPWFSNTVNVARILETVDGEITGAAVSDAIGATTDLDSFMGPAISCDGSAWPDTNSCGNKALFYEVRSDGTNHALTDEFVDVRPVD